MGNDAEYLFVVDVTDKLDKIFLDGTFLDEHPSNMYACIFLIPDSTDE
jgi:hypothetical protein